MLENSVNQIALELHLPQLPKIPQLHTPDYIYLLKILKELDKIGFSLISQEVNMAVGMYRQGATQEPIILYLPITT